MARVEHVTTSAGLEDCQRAINDLEGKLASLKAKHVSGMSPQSRAALEVMGHDLKKSLDAVLETHLQWQHRRNDFQKSRVRTTLRKSFGDAQANFERLQGEAADVLAGRVLKTETERRTLARELIAAELFAQECA